jgi:HAD superfamily hydrolase (TIGR01509 family)
VIKGVIFDMDGVLVDSEEWICRAGIAMFAEHGITASPEDFIPFVGAGEDRYLGGVAEKYGFVIDIARDKARTYELYTRMVAGKLEPLGGVHEFFAKCRSKDLKLALATAADQIKMQVNLREIGLPVETFDAAVNALDVERKKPDPEIFLLAAEKIGLAASDCLVVEDSVNGVAAGKAAGAKCLGLTTSFEAEKLSAADWIARDLSAAPDSCLAW